MDQTTVESIVKEIQNLKKNQKFIINEVMTFRDCFKNSIKKIEKNTSEMFENYNTKLENLEGQVEFIKEVFAKNSDEIVKLEKEYICAADQIRQIDKNLEEIETKLGESMNVVEELKMMTTKKDIEENHNVKECAFNRKGYCREKENCNFYHSDKICEIYLKNGVCWRARCRQRHPRPCRYFQRGNCYRGESCQYLHVSNLQTCENCNQQVLNRYFCEFCEKNFCSHCTVKEAHDRNIQKEDDDEPKCRSIHC